MFIMWTRFLLKSQIHSDPLLFKIFQPAFSIFQTSRVEKVKGQTHCRWARGQFHQVRRGDSSGLPPIQAPGGRGYS